MRRRLSYQSRRRDKRSAANVVTGASDRGVEDGVEQVHRQIPTRAAQIDRLLGTANERKDVNEKKTNIKYVPKNVANIVATGNQ